MGLIQTSGKKLTDASGAGTITYNAAGNFTAGNTVIIALTHYGSTRISGITVSGTAAVKDAQNYDATGQNAQEIWRASNVAGGSSAVVITCPAGSYVVCSFEEWDNITLSSPLDQTGTAGITTSTAPSFASGTTTQADEVVYAVYGDTGSGVNWTSSTPPAGYTETFDEPDGTAHEAGSAAYRVISATGAQTATFTTGASIPWMGCIATYKLNVGAPSVPDQLLYMPPMRAAGR